MCIEFSLQMVNNGSEAELAAWNGKKDTSREVYRHADIIVISIIIHYNPD
jgi:hypothetical protein